MEDNSEIRKLQGKKEVFNYIKERFKESKIILIHGSTAHKPVKMFSDFDIEVYGNSIKKPYYELVFVNYKPALLTVYFYKYKNGKKKVSPKEIRIIKGEYTQMVEDRKPHTLYSEGRYNTQEKIRRECQLIADFCFKYFRSKEKLYLKYIQKRIK